MADPSVQISVDRVDDAGIQASSDVDVVLDVVFGGRRVWSFWSLRDSQEPDSPSSNRRFIPWPTPLRRFLDGTAHVTIRTHVEEQVLFDADLQFGEASDPIEVINGQGKPLGIDNAGRMTMTFETRSQSQVEPLLDSIVEVLDALRVAGVQAFPAYGTLLGAVRDGALIGHDSDADLGYVSMRTDPVDVIRESFTLQRRLAGMGYRISRYSGAGFKVLVTEADGNIRGLDVFGGFFSDDHLILMGEVRTPYRKEWVFPLGTTTLEGRTLPAPADTDRFLAAMYGESWRVPDPAFAFETPEATHVRLNGWFRGTRVNRSDWDRRYQSGRKSKPRRRPDPLARFLLAREKPAGVTSVVDVGCGRGQNAWWLARQGMSSLGLDYSSRAIEYLLHRQDDELPLRFAAMNLMETRHVLAHGARIAHTPGPHAMLARHVADALTHRGRDNLWRLAQMACRPGGRLYLDFLVAAHPEDPWTRKRLLTPVSPDRVAAQLETRGGHVVLSEEIGSDEMEIPADGDEFRKERRSRRMVIEWQG